jgi:phosphate transport system substrate-binding protein
VQHIIGHDGIAIVVHPSNGVSQLTIKQVRQIYAGDITNWSDVPGSNRTDNIIVISREEGSGTRDCFEKLVMQGTLITEDALLQTSNGMLRTAVSTTPAAIGYLSLGYVDSSVKALALFNEDVGDYVEPTVANCQNGIYPLVRDLYFVTKGEPRGYVADFINFCCSDAGQEILAEEGYIPIS